MRFFLPILLLIALASAAAVAAMPDTVVIVVRHAEKAKGDSTDPGLSEVGVLRAHALAARLAEHPVNAAYVTQYRRTQLTAEPTARANHLQAEVLAVDADNAATYGATLAGLIRKKHRGQTVLVVGHSNTVPDLVKALAGVDIAPIEENEFDRLYVITLPAKGDAKVLALRY